MCFKTRSVSPWFDIILVINRPGLAWAPPPYFVLSYFSILWPVSLLLLTLLLGAKAGVETVASKRKYVLDLVGGKSFDSKDLPKTSLDGAPKISLREKPCLWTLVVKSFCHYFWPNDKLINHYRFERSFLIWYCPVVVTQDHYYTIWSAEDVMRRRGSGGIRKTQKSHTAGVRKYSNFTNRLTINKHKNYT